MAPLTPSSTRSLYFQIVIKNYYRHWVYRLRTIQTAKHWVIHSLDWLFTRKRVMRKCHWIFGLKVIVKSYTLFLVDSFVVPLYKTVWTKSWQLLCMFSLADANFPKFDISFKPSVFFMAFWNGFTFLIL